MQGRCAIMKEITQFDYLFCFHPSTSCYLIGSGNSHLSPSNGTGYNGSVPNFDSATPINNNSPSIVYGVRHTLFPSASIMGPAIQLPLTSPLPSYLVTHSHTNIHLLPLGLSSIVAPGVNCSTSGNMLHRATHRSPALAAICNCTGAILIR